MREKLADQESISKELLDNLLKFKVPIAHISSFFEVSCSVIYKAIAVFNLQQERYSDISEEQLRDVVAEVKQNHPHAGEVMLRGHLRAQGIHVQCSRVKQAIHQANRLGPSTQRRPPIRK